MMKNLRKILKKQKRIPKKKIKKLQKLLQIKFLKEDGMTIKKTDRVNSSRENLLKKKLTLLCIVSVNTQLY